MEFRHLRYFVTVGEALNFTKAAARLRVAMIPASFAETRQYLRDFNRLNEATVNARELYDAMLELYPDRVNPGSLWGAAKHRQEASIASLPPTNYL
jgi:hypothetical protein